MVFESLNVVRIAKNGKAKEAPKSINLHFREFKVIRSVAICIKTV